MFKKCTFIKSAADKTGWIDDDVPEVIFIGRSNVGKSSYINALANNRKIAKVANTPGKTRLLNFFDVNDNQFRLVDAPGYGYAKISMNLKLQFAKMMEEYFTARKNLKVICMLIDLRHKPSKDDIEMYDFLKTINKKVLIVGTKLDKLKKNDYMKNEKIIKKTLNFKTDHIFVKLSSESKVGLEESYKFLMELIGENNE